MKIFPFVPESMTLWGDERKVIIPLVSLIGDEGLLFYGE
jgi:hypothetical protein